MKARGERWWAVICLLGAVVLWSGSLSLVSIAVDFASPSTVTFWRCIVGAAALFGWITARKMRRRGTVLFLHSNVPTVDDLSPSHTDERSLMSAWCAWRWAVASGISCGMAFLLIAIGMQNVGSGPAGVVLSAIPGLTILIAHVEGHGPTLGSRHFISLLVGAVGALTLALPAGGGWSTTGLILLAFAACSHATTNVTAGRSLERLDPVVVSAVSMACAAFVALPFASFNVTIPSAGIAAIAVLGILPSGVAYVMYFHGIKVLSASAAAYSNFLVPPVAVVAGMVALGEHPTFSTIIALCLAMIALTIGLGGSKEPIQITGGRTKSPSAH